MMSMYVTYFMTIALTRPETLKTCSCSKNIQFARFTKPNELARYPEDRGIRFRGHAGLSTLMTLLAFDTYKI